MSEALAPPPRRVWWRRLAIFLVGAAVIDVAAGRIVARPLELIRRSPDPDIVYENTPGEFWGRTTYDEWKAPIYMIWDMTRTRPAGRRAVLYRIDEDGCRAPSTGPVATPADVLMVGSSQAFGMLLPAEDAVPLMLQRALQGRGFRDARVADCSVVGHRFLQTLKAIRRARPTKRPRVVAVLVRPWHMTHTFPYIEVMSPRSAALRWIIRWSTLVRLGHYYSFRNTPSPAALTAAELDAGLDAYARELQGVRTEFFLLDDGTPDCEVFVPLAAALRARGLGVHRLTTPSGPREMFIDHDRHWSVRGGQYTTAQILDQVARALAAQGLTPTP